MKTVRQLLDEKGSTVWTIAPDASVYEAIALVAEKNIGALLVVQDGKPVGLVSERDYARKVILKGHTAGTLSVRDIMTRRPVCTDPDETLEQCMAVITERRVRHLPVLECGDIIGLISIGDLVKAIIDEQQFVIEQLERYISG
ncbi:inosine-5'-monophosphate dehydrogenase [bacterium BMS3Bbin12]|nr:inosine-5'-monophosphate dehydrogenase [bacterium BMS3Abin12]GBE47684.1 inosine-5'-monophosphate dehydrogenase [bacterium BMS3Bbin12]GBE49964.1 inosine-5'-monophosphate dehydrogenase [bacterium BMS3Bbin13]HDK03512.1 CBS domain-containing protein [Gammaproteobacteria bacterium]